MPHRPALRVTWACILLLGIPLIVALAWTGEPLNRWIAGCIAIAVVYLLGVAWQQHQVTVELEPTAPPMGLEAPRLGSDPEPQASPCPPVEVGEGTLDEKQIEFLNSLREESDPEILEKLIGQFRRQSYVEELRGALERGDRIGLQGCAHRLKGTSSLLGSTRLPRLCAQLEMASRKGLKEECLRQLSLIEVEHGRVLHALSAMFTPDLS